MLQCTNDVSSNPAEGRTTNTKKTLSIKIKKKKFQHCSVEFSVGIYKRFNTTQHPVEVRWSIYIVWLSLA